MTTIRSSNFTNLCPCTSGISRVTAAGKSCIGTPAGSASATVGRRRLHNRRIRDAHHALVDAAALLVAQRELDRRVLVARRAAGGLIHRPSILVSDPAMAVMGRCEGDANTECNHDRGAQCGPPDLPHDTFL